MKTLKLTWVLALLTLSARADIPYPIIFVHGIAGGNFRTFETCIQGVQANFGLPSPAVYHVCLNHDGNHESALLAEDVDFIGFTTYGGTSLINPSSNCRIFAINFDNDVFPNPAEHVEPNGNVHSGSNQAAILKQGFALSHMIDSVLSITGKDKVILVGHSMGGLAIREYLQRTTTADGPHRWWIDPEIVDGHHVVQVVTTGTPHLGSNAGTPDPGLLSNDRDTGIEFDNEKEASRDLHYDYDSYPQCPQENSIGIYLFGGNEHCLWEPLDHSGRYRNVDIDCDGSENDDVIGLNSDTRDNPLMPLPQNINYTWITNNYYLGESILRLLSCQQWAILGDGAVLLDRQWLYNASGAALPLGYADTLLTNDIHTSFSLCSVYTISEGNDIVTLMRALDEPDDYLHAFDVAINSSFKGATTTQQSMIPGDLDVYRLHLDTYSNVNVTVDVGGGTNSNIEVYSMNNGFYSYGYDNSTPPNLNLNLPPGTYFLSHTAFATSVSYAYPYEISIQATPIPLEANFTAAPVSGQVPLPVQFSNTSIGPIMDYQWDFDLDGDTDSTLPNPSWTYQAPGVYSIRLTVVAPNYSTSLTRAGYIQVGENPGPTVQPLPVDDLSIQLVDADTALLSWSPITQDVNGNSITCVYYDVYHGTVPEFSLSGENKIGTTSSTSFSHELSGDMGFYRITAQSCQSWQGLDMVTIPTGQFMMGQAGTNGVPEHQVTLTHAFLLGRTEVTNAQFLEALNWAKAQGLVSVVGDYVKQYNVNLLRISQSGQDSYEIRYNTGTQQFYLHAGTYDAGIWGPGQAYPSGSYDPANHPVKYVSWYGAACYCDWLSQMYGLPAYYNGQWSQTPSPNNPYTATGYRLPNEAEWEFATQFDDERTYPWGSVTPTCTVANYMPSGYCVGWTSPVGTHPAGVNALGLQDMAGNLEEWCNDWYSAYGNGAQTDPVGPTTGSNRALRGGCFDDNVSSLYCAYRNYTDPSLTRYISGFRLCKTAF